MEDLLEERKGRGDLVKFTLRTTPSKYKGKAYTSTSNERYVVIGQTDLKQKGQGYKWHLIEFDDKTRLVVHSKSLTMGGIKNPNTPIVCGVGYVGQGIYSKKRNYRAYTIWRAMLQRCYSRSCQERHPSYKGCSVEDSWHNFQNFCEDIKLLENYDRWILGQDCKRNPYEIDKDSKNRDNKIYSKENCRFITTKENNNPKNRKPNLTGKIYEAINLITGEIIQFTNQSSFSREYNIPRYILSRCLTSSNPFYDDWEFKVLN